MHIPYPMEIMESRIENECDKVTSDGKYPCAKCNEPNDLDGMVCVSPMGDGPMICGDCAAEEWPEHFGDEALERQKKESEELRLLHQDS